MIVFDSDDFGASKVISDMCQSHDCRDQLDKFHMANPAFKATLFAIPGYMTPELLEWCDANKSWIELAVHGFFHRSNYECEKMTYEEMAWEMERFKPMIELNFVRGFKAPGWQISNDCLEWLDDNGWWVADQAYNDERRPEELPAYVNDNGVFFKMFNKKFIRAPETNKETNMAKQHDGTVHDIESTRKQINGLHSHTWNCVGNGVYELEEQILEQIKDETEFKFISEILA